MFIFIDLFSGIPSGSTLVKQGFECTHSIPQRIELSCEKLTGPITCYSPATIDLVASFDLFDDLRQDKVASTPRRCTSRRIAVRA